MAFSVLMPALGESVAEGTVTRWLKQEGDAVQVDEPLLEVSTDKVDTEIPSPVAGVVARLIVAENDTVPVGTEVAIISDPSDAPVAVAAETGLEQGGQASPDQSSHAEQPQAEQPQAEQPQAEQPNSEQPSPEQPSPEQPSQSTAPSGAATPGTPVTMPALGESVAEGTLTRWLKNVGDQVQADEPLLEVSTDKVDTEIPSPASGVLTSIEVQVDQTVPVGTLLATIRDPATAPSPAPAQPAPQQTAAAAPAQAAPAEPQAPNPAAESVQPEPAPAPVAQAQPQQQSAPAATSTPQPPTNPTNTGAYVTPLVRKLANEHGVELSALVGTGVGGRVRKQDVLDAAEKAKQQQEASSSPPATASSTASAPPPAKATPLAVSPQRGTREPMSRLRSVIATRMVESLQTSAQLTTVVEVDLTRIAALRAKAKRDFEAREGVKLSYLPFLAKATIEVLKAHAKLNASIDGKDIVYHDTENLGIAVDTDRGLLVPVIKNAGDLNLAGMARRIAELAERTRTNSVTPDDLTGATFTLTNTGSRGALFDTPIINQPQVGILGTGALVKRPVVLDTADGEVIAVRSMMYLALSYDHRLVDGADAARFLSALKQRLEEAAFAEELGL